MKVIQVKQRTPEWHEYRARRITGSTAAAILGASKYGTPLTEWLRLTGRRTPDRVETPWMRWGTMMEPVNADLYRERFHDRELAREELTIEHPEIPWLAYSPDGFVAIKQAGRTGLWEAKAPSPFNSEWRTQVPLDNVIQVQIGMACTGLDWASVSALVWPSVQVFEIERDSRFIDAAINKLTEFMEYHVARDIPPAATGSDLDTDALATIGSGDAAWTMTAEVEDLWNKYATVDAQRKDAEARVDAIKNRLVQLTGRTLWKEAKAAIESARKLKAV